MQAHEIRPSCDRRRGGGGGGGGGGICDCFPERVFALVLWQDIILVVTGICGTLN